VRRGLTVVLVVAIAAACARTAGAGARPRVTLITDSVGASLGWDATAARLFDHGLDVELELRSCRRLTTPSCAVAGTSAPESALQTIRRLGASIAPNVVIDVGYNDSPSVYAPGIEEVLRALAAARVEHVFWVTLHAARGAYVESNSAIYAAARRHPQVTVVDWNAYAAAHADWFGPDGIHLTGDGAEGLAVCMRSAIVRVLEAPPPIDVALAFPRGITPGFHAQLVATGGHEPYRFRVRGLPAGLRATRRGGIVGASVRRGRFVLRVRVRDARGETVTRRIPFFVA